MNETGKDCEGMENREKAELFDLYTRERELLGRTMARGERVPDGACRLIVHACIFGTDGRMLIQRRQPWKRSYPGMWDISVSGSVKAGEGSAEAMIREAREELGIELCEDELSLSTTIYSRHRIDDVYTVVKAIRIEDLTLQYDEVAEARFATLREIESMTKTGSFVGYRSELIRFLFSIRDGDGVMLSMADARKLHARQFERKSRIHKK